MTKLQKISAEVLKAYADCHVSRYKFDERSLTFRASGYLKGEEFRRLMKTAIGVGYNEFDEEIIDKLVNFFGESSHYTIARESSVCVYIKPKDKTKNIPMWPLRVDEVSYNVETGEFRLWWD
jgi:hypothetical protein